MTNKEKIVDKTKLKTILKTFQTKFNKLRKNKSMMAGEILYINNGKKDTKPIQKNKMSLWRNILQIIYRISLLLVRNILQLYYGKGKIMPPIKDLTLLESATSLAHKIRTKKLKSVDVVKSFIDRINEINPILNCVVDQRYEEALKEAAMADELIESGKLTEDELLKQKPFLGVPISTKDCIQVKNMIHTAGLWKRRNVRAVEDAKAIASMRQAGAIPFALTNISEVCMWWESFNTIHGRTNNPYDTSRIVGGSSGGEGCIQGAAASPFGIGSDIGGSIRMPAFFNGVFGHKPTKFIVPNHGQFPAPFSEEQDSFLGIGPICRFAIDLKPVLKIIAGPKADILKLDEPVNLSEIRYFYQEDDGGGFLVQPVERDLRECLHKVIKHLEQSVTKKQPPQRVQFEKFKQSAAIWFANMKDSSGKGFDHQLANLDGEINPYTELFKWFFGSSNHTLVGLLTAIIEKGQTQHGTDKHLYLVSKRDELLLEIKDLLGDDGVLIYPTHPTVAPYHTEPIARTLNFSYTAIINCLGLPATAIPLGLNSEGLPLGLQVIANHNQDRLCLAVALELERAFGGWTAPTINV
ncbi:fatty-acid amide hydrolase 2-A [Condylostylus longicornis]|uniref:fatty-acid amide hydrolase 2-A n=1 Tax=Condylostylus longicornis TaxID=2530218 RepID=UPI00244DCF5D|nr:fatty-acid amide hydrolase 2-A [Condylostylus longicornis]